MDGDDTPRTAEAPRAAPRVICIGGGRGGVGKSLLTTNLGVYLAQIGRDVVIADADPSGAGVHAMLGLDVAPSAPTSDDEPCEPVATPVQGLRLVPSAFDPAASALLRPSRPHRWALRLERLQADYVIVDLGAGASNAALDLFLGADVGVCVTVPEPPAIEATYRFLRALYVRRLRRSLVKERFRLRLVDRATQHLGALPTPLEIIEAIARFDVGVANLARAELAQLQPQLVVSQTRLRADLDLGGSMRMLADRCLGIDLDYLGHVEHDDAVWLTVRRRRPLLIDSPTSKSARNVERIARRVLALVTSRDGRAAEPAPRSRPTAAPLTLYETLVVPRGASDEEVRRAYKRQREVYAAGSLPLTSLLYGDALASEQRLLDEAHDTLLDPARRRAYDHSTFPEPEPAPPPTPIGEGGAVGAERAMLEAELLREIGPDTHFTGALLRKVREARGIELADVAARTKIALSHLRALEEEAFATLPAVVYTRGFVQELAKALGLDPSHVARSYLARMREALALAGRASR